MGKTIAKECKRIVVLLIVLAMSCAMIPVNSNIAYAAENSNDDIDVSEWMKYMPDDILITRINMPGSHDAGMYNPKTITTRWVDTQDLNLEEQLLAGSRFLDIRVGAGASKTPENMIVNHNGREAYKAKTGEGEFLRIDSVRDTINKFLTEHESETVVLFLQAEWNSSEEKDGAKDIILNQMKPKLKPGRLGDKSKWSKFDFYPTTSDVPTLRAVRGRCVIICDEETPVARTKYEDHCRYYAERKIKYIKKFREDAKRGALSLYRDDKFLKQDYDNEKGKEGDPYVKLCYMSTNPVGPLSLIHASPRYNSELIYKEFENASWDHNKRYGWIPMDYVGVTDKSKKIIKNIIKSNEGSMCYVADFICNDPYGFMDETLILEEIFEDNRTKKIDLSKYDVKKEVFGNVCRVTVNGLPLYRSEDAFCKYRMREYPSDDFITRKEGHTVSSTGYTVIDGKWCDLYVRESYVVGSYKDIPIAMHWECTDEGGFKAPTTSDGLFEICDKLTIKAKSKNGSTKTIDITKDNETEGKPYVDKYFTRIDPKDGTRPYYVGVIRKVFHEGTYDNYEVTDIEYKDLKEKSGLIFELDKLETDATGYAIKTKVVSIKDKRKVSGTVGMIDGEDVYGLRAATFDGMFPITVKKAVPSATGELFDDETVKCADKKSYENVIKFCSYADRFTSDFKPYTSYKYCYADNLLNGKYKKLGETGNAVQYALMAPTDLTVIWNIADDETVPAEFAGGLSVEITDEDDATPDTISLTAEPKPGDDNVWISDAQNLQLFNNGTADSGYYYNYKFDSESIDAIVSKLDSEDFDVETYAMTDVDDDGYPERHFVICCSSKRATTTVISGNVIWKCADLKAKDSSKYVSVINEVTEEKVDLIWPTNNYFYANLPKTATYHIEAERADGYKLEHPAGTNDYIYTKLIDVTLESSDPDIFKGASEYFVSLLQNGNYFYDREYKKSYCKFESLPMVDSNNMPYKYTVGYKQGDYLGWKMDAGNIIRDKDTGDITIKVELYRDEENLEIPVELNLGGAKIDDEFQFVIDGLTDKGELAGDSYKLELNASDSKGKFIIPASEFTDSQKDYYFTVYQIPGSNEYVDYDEREVSIKANVVYDGDKKLVKAEFGRWENDQWKPLPDINKAEFNNFVSIIPAQLDLNGLKHLSKKPDGCTYAIPASDFVYQLTIQTNGDNEIELARGLVSDNADGTPKDIIFTSDEDAVNLYSQGDYKLKLRTLNMSDKGWYYDETPYTINVKVSEDDTIPNKLIIKPGDISYDERLIAQSLTISQIYSEIKFKIPVKNTIEGIDSTSDRFEFRAQDLSEDTAPFSTEIVGAGEKEFDEVTYYAPGNYDYEVYEEPAYGNIDWKHDDSVKYYNVKVIRDKATGALKLDDEAMAEESIPEFTNAYVNQTVTVSVIWADSKDDSGDRPNRPASIGFTLNADGVPVGGLRTVSGDKSSFEWPYETEVLPAYKLVDGQKREIDYTIDTDAIETAIGDHYDIECVGSLHGGFVIACYEKGILDTEDIPVRVVWDDEENRYSTRPEYMLISLETNLGFWNPESIYFNEGNEWKSTFKDVPKYFIDENDKKQEVVFKVNAEPLLGYKQDIYLDKDTGEYVIKYCLLTDTFWIEPVEDEIYTGRAIKPDVKVHYGVTRLIKDKDYTLQYANNVNVGFATVTVVGKGNYSNRDSVAFNINPKDISEDDVYVSLEDRVYTGKQVISKPVITYGGITLKEGRDYTVTYSGDQIKEGVVNVKISGSAQNGGKGNYTGERIASYKIYNKNNKFSKVYVKKIPNQTYTGGKITLNKDNLMVYEDKSMKKLLVENKDYVVQYMKNCNVGTATAVIKGIGDYAGYGGSKKAKFKIVARGLSDAKIVVEDNLVYSGSKLKPEIKVYIGDQRINPKYYKVKYVNNKNAVSENAAKAPKVIVTGRGNYSKSVSKTFSIESKTILKSDITVFTNIVTDNKNIKTSVNPTVKLGGVKLKRNRDYVVTDVVSSADSTMKTAKISFIGNYKGDVEAPVRTVSDTEKIAFDDTFSVNVAEVKYTGKEVKPKITVVDNISGKKLSRKEYNVSYNNNVNISDTAPEVVITGKGQYTGTITKNFRIYKNSITKAYFEKIPNKEYTGYQITPSASDIHVYADKNKTMLLTEGTDYTIEYGDNVKTGTGIVKIKGIGNYGGTKKMKFLIVPKILSWLVN